MPLPNPHPPWAGWAEEQIDSIEGGHRGLRRALLQGPAFKARLEECDGANTLFDEGWAICNGRFPNLKLFAGALATVFPNTATVEADFPGVKLQKTDHRTSLTDFSLEGCLHAKQYDILRGIVEKHLSADGSESEEEDEDD